MMDTMPQLFLPRCAWLLYPPTTPVCQSNQPATSFSQWLSALPIDVQEEARNRGLDDAKTVADSVSPSS